MALFRVIAAQMLYVAYIVVQITRSQTESRILRHTLPLELESTFGSSDSGGCSTVTSVDNLEICEGESVLNDGNTPSIVPDRTSLWATPLFTMRRNGTDTINVTFELENGPNRDRVELAVFNCPERGIYAPSVNVYSDSTLNNPQTRWLIANKTLPDTSCDHLIKFCVDFNGATGLRFLTLEFPYQTNSSWVYLGEVTFLDGGSSPCDLPELIDATRPPLGSPTTDIGIDTTSNNITLLETTKPTSENDSGSPRTSCVATALTTGVVSVIITAILVAGVSIGVHFAVYQCVYKPRMRGTENSVSGEGDTVTYEVVEERIGTVVKMEQNEAYGIARSS